jgi:hypothetical protein
MAPVNVSIEEECSSDVKHLSIFLLPAWILNFARTLSLLGLIHIAAICKQ